MRDAEGVIQDCADLASGFEQIRRSEAAYRLLACNVIDVIVRFGLDGTCDYISPSIKDLVGYTPEEVLGHEVQSYVHPDDCEAFVNVLSEVQAGLDRKILEHRVLHQDGSVIWVETQFKSIFGDDGVPIEIVAVARDIRERKAAAEALAASQARYRMLADMAGEMITQFTITSVITFMSPGCRLTLGYEPEDMLGRNFIAMMPPEEKDYVENYYKALIPKGSGALGGPIQVRARHKDGRWIWLEGQPKVLFDKKTGRANGVQDVMRDITHRKQLEKELENALVAAESASVVKAEFLSNMSHELRTPLTSILGFSSLLSAEKGLTDQGRNAVKRVAGSSQALLTIVNDILDFSKLEAGQVEIDARSVAPVLVLENAMSLLEPQARTKGLTLRFETDASLPAFVAMDDERVRQVLLNLIGNGLKFTTRGGVLLKAGYTVEGNLRCEVTDTGPGIGMDRLDRLFKRFSQVDASTTRAFGGTGLGLAICKGLIEAMNGAIGVTSVVGQGSTFWFEFPCPVVEPACKSEAVNDKALIEMPRGSRVLVVDDNAANRELVPLMLAPFGLSISTACGGEEAISLAAAAPFDLILMDIRMPGMDGPAAARAIRGSVGQSRAAPILAFTADAADITTLKEMEGLFDGYLAKPIVPHVLFETVADWVNLQASFVEVVEPSGEPTSATVKA